jgi:hypothetical protein
MYAHMAASRSHLWLIACIKHAAHVAILKETLCAEVAR